MSQSKFLKWFPDYDVTKDLRFIEGFEKGEKKGIIKGIEQCIEKGIDLGIEKEKTANIINSYKNGISIPLIANIFGLDEAKIQQILKDNNLI